VLQLGSMAVLARVLAPKEFGLFSLVTPLVSFFLVFRDIGLSAATVYTDAITDREVTAMFWLNVAAGLLLTGVVAALAPLAGWLYNDPRLINVLLAMSSTFLISGICAQYQALLQRHFRFKLLASIDLGANAVGTLASICAAFAGWSYWSLFLMPIVSQLITLVGCVSLSQWHPGRPSWQARSASMAKFGSAVTGFNLLNYFARNSDNLAIGKLWGLEALGYYGRAYSLMMAPLSQIIFPLTQVVVPVLTRVNNNRELYVSTFQTLLRCVLMICMPVVTWLICSRSWIVQMLLGERWSEVVSIFLPLGFAALIQPLNNAAGWLLLSQGRSRDIFLWGLIGSALTVATILLGLSGGARGVAISYAAGQILFVTPLLWIFTCRSGWIRIRDVIRVPATILAACAVSGGTFEILRAANSELFASLSALSCACLALGWVGSVTLALLTFDQESRRSLSEALNFAHRFIPFARVVRRAT
jgi:O-antigen/teichoic acid export membrane protein